MINPTTAGSRNPGLLAGWTLFLAAILLAGGLKLLPQAVALAAAGGAGLVLLWLGWIAHGRAVEAAGRADAMGRVFAASETVLSSLEAAHVLRTAGEAAARLSWHASAALLYSIDETRRATLRSSFGLEPPPGPAARLPTLDAYVADALQHRRSVVSALPAPAAGGPHPPALDGLRSVCLLPLQSRAGTAGILVLLSPKGPRAFADELPTLQYFASQAAMAIDNARLYQQVQDLFLSTIKSLAAAVDAKDAYTHGHSEAIAELVAMIARDLKLPPQEEDKIRLAGLLHDVGKIGIPDAILRKPGTLDATERAVMMSHAALGATIIDRPGPLQDLVSTVRHHHEWYDGRGYPDGLRGDAIPLGAAILAVADAFDAMTSHRTYHGAQPVDTALNELRRHAGTQFHPGVVDAIIRVIERERGARSPWYVRLEHRIADTGSAQPPTVATAPVEAAGSGPALRLAQELRHTDSLAALLERIAQVAPGLLGLQAFAICLVDARAQVLTVAAVGGATNRLELRPGARIVHGRSPAWRAVERRAAERSDDGAAVFVPLVTLGRTIGVLLGSGDLSEERIRLLSLAADAIAPAIHAAQLHQRAQQEEGRDALTGLRNRTGMVTRLQEEVGRRGRHGTSFTLVLAGVDDLPQFNVAHGFGAGDELIRSIGALLRQHLRPADAIGRIAGGTFAILMPGLADAEVARSVQRLQDLFNDRQIPIQGRFVPTLALSWVVVRCPQDASDPEVLLAHAERQLLGTAGHGRTSSCAGLPAPGKL